MIDPSAGLGTTRKMACTLSRHYVGYEVHAEYTAIASQRLKEPLHLHDPLIAERAKLAMKARPGVSPRRVGAPGTGL